MGHLSTSVKPSGDILTPMAIVFVLLGELPAGKLSAVNITDHYLL